MIENRKEMLLSYINANASPILIDFLLVSDFQNCKYGFKNKAGKIVNMMMLIVLVKDSLK